MKPKNTDKFKLVLLRKKQRGINRRLEDATRTRLESAVSAQKPRKGTG